MNACIQISIYSNTIDMEMCMALSREKEIKNLPSAEIQMIEKKRKPISLTKQVKTNDRIKLLWMMLENDLKITESGYVPKYDHKFH